MKDLLRITQLDEKVCKIEVGVNSDEEGEMLSANLLGVLINGGPRVVAAVMAAEFAYILSDEKDLEKLAARASLSLPQTQHTS